MSDPVLVALITAGFGFLGILVEVGRRQNNRDHHTNAAKLNHLVDGQRRVESKIDSHIVDHAKGDL